MHSTYPYTKHVLIQQHDKQKASSKNTVAISNFRPYNKVQNYRKTSLLRQNPTSQYIHYHDLLHTTTNKTFFATNSTTYSVRLQVDFYELCWFVFFVLEFIRYFLFF